MKNKKCEVKLEGCQEIGIRKINGHWHCPYCAKSMGAMVMAIQHFREEQKSDTLSIDPEELNIEFCKQFNKLTKQENDFIKEIESRSREKAK